MKKVIWQIATKKRVDSLINHSSKIVDIELVIENDLDLRENVDLTSLPANLKVEGNLILIGCLGITILPENLEVGGNLDLTNCINLKSLPNSLKANNIILTGCRK